MASNLKKSGSDLDTVFAPLEDGMTPAAATGIKVAGADLNTRYAPLVEGISAPVTNFRKSGADLNTIFAAYGSTALVAFHVGNSTSHADTHDASADCTLTIMTNGSWKVVAKITVLATGIWRRGTEPASNFEYRFVGSSSVNGDIDTGWTSMSGGFIVGASANASAPEVPSETDTLTGTFSTRRVGSTNVVDSDVTLMATALASG